MASEDRVSGQPRPSDRKGNRLVELNYASPLRIDELAARVQMSAPTFHQHFHQLTGTSPLQYQKWLRLNEAKRTTEGLHTARTVASAL
jgi:AraC-like DNA-binding protein